MNNILNLSEKQSYFNTRRTQQQSFIQTKEKEEEEEIHINPQHALLKQLEEEQIFDEPSDP